MFVKGTWAIDDFFGAFGPSLGASTYDKAARSFAKDASSDLVAFASVVPFA